ncbi:zinc finger, RING/FYVE/PHD-type containing protein [Tanacetum coccineum]
MRPPVVTSWMGRDGITVHGIICKNDGIIRLKNRCQLDDCLMATSGDQLDGSRWYYSSCCLPCGHMYGFSCIKKWLLLSSSSGKCPQCNTLCSFQDEYSLSTHLALLGAVVLGLADALRRRVSLLEPWVEALRQRTDVLERLVSALRRRMDALVQRSDTFDQG